MGRLAFIKLLAVLTCYVAGSLVVGLALVDVNINSYHGGKLTSTEALAEDPAAREKRGNQRVEIALVGDVLLASGVGDAIAAHGPDYPWQGTAEVIRESDVTIANLECAVSERGDPEPDKEFTFRASPRSLAGAARAGVDVFTLANNHVLDFGRSAMLDTISHIKENGLKWAGAGINREEATRPAVLDVQGKRVAVLAFTRIIFRSSWIAEEDRAGVASGQDYRSVMEAVKAAENWADITVVSMHWGDEYEEFPHERDVKLARELVDAGADIVTGHHPHVIQGIEIYKGKVIAYSLGNFIFTTPRSPRAREGAILKVTAEGNGDYSAIIIPTYIDGGTTTVLKGVDRARVLERINRLSDPFMTAVDAEGVVHKKP